MKIKTAFSIYKKIISLPRKVTGFTLRRKGEKYQIIALSNPGGKKVIVTFDNYPQAKEKFEEIKKITRN